jgi:hypothetical protein
LIASNRELVLRVAQGYIETIYAFKTEPQVYIPVLERFLNIDDRTLVEDQYAFFVQLYPQVPRVALSSAGLASIRDVFVGKYPKARQLQESDFVDSTIVDELEGSGFIGAIYGE